MTFNEELRQIPFLRLAIPFILGIVLQIHFHFSVKFIFEVNIVILIIIITIWLSKRINRNYHLRWIYGFFVHILLIQFGIELVSIESSKANLTKINKGEIFVMANIIESPEEKEKSVKVTGKVISIRDSNQWVPASEKMLVYFEKDSLSTKLEFGDQIIIKSVFNEIKNANNPKEFDYKTLMVYRHIYRQAYVKSGNWKLINKNKGNIVLLYSNKLRNHLLQLYRDNGIKDDEFSVASALTLGYKDALDKEIKRSYSSSGAMHILAVSGLHVGIIYLILFYILFFFKRYRFGLIIRGILIILFLWSYAFLTGLSPSVMRATIMFSFVIIGQSLKRPSNIYNTLAMSAFLMLLINPFMIMEIGFQLSYLAVIGIVYFQPKIYSLLQINNWLLDKLWALVTVSFAAQLGTSPMILFYFHQFPNYFLLTNIIVIPFATLIIYLGASVFIFSFISVVSSFLAKILAITVKILNSSVSFIEQLPYSISEGISISVTETLIFYLLIIFISSFFIYKQIRYLHYGLIAVIGLLSFAVFQNNKSVFQKKFFVYNVSGTSVFDFIDGKNNILISDFSSEKKEENLLYHVQNNWLFLGVSEGRKIDLNTLNRQKFLSSDFPIYGHSFLQKNYMFKFGGKKFLFLRNNELKNYLPGKKIDIDYLILSDNVQIPVKKLVSFFNLNQIIIDSSNSGWIKNKWLKECLNNNIKCFSVSDEGAFHVDL